MNRMQRDVAYFNETVGAVRGEMPALRDTKLRARLILEEACETVVAMIGHSNAVDEIEEALEVLWKQDWKGPDIVEAIDGLCDLAFVTFGAFDAFGVDAEPHWDAVHEANMTKANAPKDQNGKVMKPPGFEPPQEKIRALLVAAGWKP